MFPGFDGNHYWTEWLPADYLIEIYSGATATKECQICIMPNENSSELIFGSSFLRGYYSEFDKSANAVSFAPNTGNSK